MWQDFKGWLSTPFSTDMSAGHWFLFIGLLIVIIVLWNLLLNTLREIA
jgi:hypothetical protein